MDKDEEPGKGSEVAAEDEKTSRREVLRKAGPAAYVAPGLLLLAVPAKAQMGSPLLLLRKPWAGGGWECAGCEVMHAVDELPSG